MFTFIRTLILAAAGLAMAAGFVLPAAAASASPVPPTVNHCHDLWANPVLHKLPLFCYANETAAEKAPHL
jgi:hypothetical protein